ncbi:unnamed protein product [marine sediment metagenome]|uniref:Uncharacterized protein n=1 Tax=marine sediment metagenome TaxID=412755 RepID=X1BWY2_9ZZZZ
MLFLGCKKKEEPDPTYRYMTAELKETFKFKEGTYWVFEDTVNGWKDCVYVTKYTYNVLSEDDADPTKPRDSYEIYFSSSFSGIKYKDQSGYWSSSDPDIASGDFNTRGVYDPADNLIYTEVIYHSPTTKNEYYDADKTIQVVSTSATVTIGSTNYGNAVKVHFQSNNILDEEESYYYFVKNIGLAKKELINLNQTWTLTDFLVVI